MADRHGGDSILSFPATMWTKKYTYKQSQDPYVPEDVVLHDGAT